MRRAVLFGTAGVISALAAGTATAAPNTASHRFSAHIATSGHPTAASLASFTLTESLPGGDRSASYRVTFGDETTAAHGTKPPKTLTHRYKKPGRYSVVLTVSDKRRTSLSEHTTVLVTAAPVARGGAGTGTTSASVPATTPPPAPSPSSAATPSSSGTPAPTPSSTVTSGMPDPSSSSPAPATTSPATQSPTPSPTTAAPTTAPAVALPTGALSASTLATALAAQGITTATAQLKETGLLALRITETAPQPWPGDPADPTAAPTASGWVVWPEGIKPTGLVLYAHGCCSVPTDLAEEAATVAAPTDAVVVAMDYRDAADYAPGLAAEDSAAAVASVQAALPAIGETVAYGISEGGAVAGLMVERHPALADDWVDDAGPVDLETSADLWREELADKASEGSEIDTAQAQNLLDLYETAVGTPVDPVREAAISPIDHTATLAHTRLRQAFLIHASGDAVVDYENTSELVTDLAGVVPTHLLTLVPAAGQPKKSSAYHITADATNAALADVELALTGSPSSSGPTTGTQTLAVPAHS